MMTPFSCSNKHWSCALCLTILYYLYFLCGLEQATDASLASENWALNMEICDLINDTEDGPKDGIKALRKRLQQNAGKNYTVVMYTLTVSSNCLSPLIKLYQLNYKQSINMHTTG